MQSLCAGDALDPPLWKQSAGATRCRHLPPPLLACARGSVLASAGGPRFAASRRAQSAIARHYSKVTALKYHLLPNACDG